LTTALADPSVAGRRRKFSDDELRSAFALKLNDAALAARFGCSIQLIRLRRSELRLLHRVGRQRKTSNPAAPTKSRFEPKTVSKRAILPPVDHPALWEARTIYPSTVVEVSQSPRLFVSGANHWKIGDRISKGPLRGFPIYTLTLEERATCPTLCRHWRSCYGNHMHLARRLKHGRAFEERLAQEIAFLQGQHPRGFAVRLHILGDFYSVAYVDLWASFLQQHRALFVFGFTARHERHDPIAQALLKLSLDHWPRFAIRFSNAPVDECSTVSVEHHLQVPDDAILCPQQVGKTRSCGTCGLCWHTKRRIAFLQH